MERKYWGGGWNGGCNCRGICDREACHTWVTGATRPGAGKWYEGGFTYCSKCEARFAPDKFLIMNTPVKRCICCHERLRVRPKIQRGTTEQRYLTHKYIE